MEWVDPDDDDDDVVVVERTEDFEPGDIAPLAYNPWRVTAGVLALASDLAGSASDFLRYLAHLGYGHAKYLEKLRDEEDFRRAFQEGLRDLPERDETEESQT